VLILDSTLVLLSRTTPMLTGTSKDCSTKIRLILRSRCLDNQLHAAILGASLGIVGTI